MEIRCHRRDGRNTVCGLSQVNFYRNTLGKSRSFAVSTPLDGVIFSVSVRPQHPSTEPSFFLSHSYYRARSTQNSTITSRLVKGTDLEFYLHLTDARPSKFLHFLTITITYKERSAVYEFPPLQSAGHKFETTKGAKRFYSERPSTVLRVLPREDGQLDFSVTQSLHPGSLVPSSSGPMGSQEEGSSK